MCIDSNLPMVSFLSFTQFYLKVPCDCMAFLRSSSLFHISKREFGTSSFLQSRILNIKQNGIHQDGNWNKFRQSTPLTFREQCKAPFTLVDDIHESDPHVSTTSPLPENCIANSLVLEPFGQVNIIKGDLLNQTVDCIVLPIPPNLTPTNGIGLFISILLASYIYSIENTSSWW